MKLEQSFEVAAPVERVWGALIDVEQVAPCLPGATITGRNDDGSYNGSFTIKIGPTTASYAGKLEMTEVDEASRSATMHAHGNDKRGQGGADATIFSKVAPTGAGGTRVEVLTDYHITGRLARFGRGGMIEDISQRLLREFAQRLQDSLTDGSAADAGAGALRKPEGLEPADQPRSGPVGAPSTPPSAGVTEPDGAEAEGAEAAVAEADGAEADGAEAAVAEAAAPPLRQPPTPSEPVQALPLVGSVMLDRLRRNPAPLGVIGALLLALFVLRRARR
jgi:carbon monoxide dehydrogenase subunit G